MRIHLGDAIPLTAEQEWGSTKWQLRASSIEDGVATRGRS